MLWAGALAGKTVSEATFWRMEAEQSGSGLRDRLRGMDHGELVAMIVALCSGVYPRAARDSVLAEMRKREGIEGD